MIDFHKKTDKQKRILLTSVFGPYAQDDEWGSRKMNPMELYQNQVTRTQGPFSLRMFHRSWGIMLIQANIEAPCTVLDFPERERFIEEIKNHEYDVIGITSIIPNFYKVKEMCRLVRKYLPNAEIAIGSHIANVPDLKDQIDADHIVKGEGVRWFRQYLGEDTEKPINHPVIVSGYGTRTSGVAVDESVEDVAATIIPSVGCPVGCNFCSTSAMFGGKGKHINFYETGDQLFDIMEQVEEQSGAWSFFMMDENFLFHKKRALRLLELIEEHDKAWSLNVFSSARVLESYTIDQLVRLGVSWVWMGLEGKDSQYNKLDHVDTYKLVKRLQSHGIRVLGSTIIGLEEHTVENIDAAIDFSVRHDTDFHQYMLYTPIPGTPLAAELKAAGVMKAEDEFHPGDIHGQAVFNYHHPNIPAGAEGEMMVRAFNRDFEVNGPSTIRIVRTTLQGWRRYKNHSDERIRRRYALDAKTLAKTMSALVGAAKLYYRDHPRMYEKMAGIAKELAKEYGWKSRFYSFVGGRYVIRKIRAEEKRLAEGWSYEPPTFYDTEATYVVPRVSPIPRPDRGVLPVLPEKATTPEEATTTG